MNGKRRNEQENREVCIELLGAEKECPRRFYDSSGGKLLRGLVVG